MSKYFRVLPVLILVIATLAGLMLAAASRVSSAPPPGNKYAVVIGIADYPGTANDLTYTDDDAQDIRTALINQMGFSSDNINLLIDSAATASAIQSAITSWLDSRESSDDLVVFFFSGHGTHDDDDNPPEESDGQDEFICAYDSNIRDDTLDSWLSNLESSHIVIWIDSCYSGGMVKQPGITVKCLPGTKDISALGDSIDGFAKDLNKSGRFVATACDDSETSIESSVWENGLFTEYLLESFTNATDSNTNNYISAQESFTYLSPIVTSQATTLFGHDQNPQQYDGHSGELDLTASATRIYLPVVLKGYPPLPGSLESVADTCIMEGYPTTNFGDTIDMWAGYDDYLSPDGKIVRSLIKFDVSSIPSASYITNVTLKVYMCESWDYPGRSRTITAYRIGSSWSEMSVTWNSRPSYAESYGSVAIKHGSFGWYSLDVTNLVKAWVSGTYANYGVMLRGPEHSGSDSSWRAFYTRESSYVPELVITYISGLSVRYALSSEAVSDSASSLRIMDLLGISLDQGTTPVGEGKTLSYSQ